MAQQQQPLQHHYEGGGFLRQRLLLATLTGTPVRISRMHLSPPSANAAAPSNPLTPDFSPLQQQQKSPHVRGVQPYEASLLRLLCSITEGSRVHINAAGTTLTYYPGQLIGCDPEKCLGGAPLVHHCHSSKPISYYVEPLLLLAPFCKHPLHIKFTGVTDLDTCISNSSRSSNSNSSNNNSSRNSNSNSSNSNSNSNRSSTGGERREGGNSDDGGDAAGDGRSYDSDDGHVRSSSASDKRNDGRKCSGNSKDISSGNGGRWSFVCADPPIDFVRSVTIPTLQRLLRLATTPARVGSSSRAESSSSGDSNSSSSSSTSKPGKEESEVRRAQELPEPFYLLRVLRRCCGSQKRRTTAAGGAAASDFGEVLLKTHGILREPLQPFVWVDIGRVKRIRGTAFAAGGISPLFAKRCISRARYIFNMLLPDVWIYLEKQQPRQHPAGATRSSSAQGRTSAAATETSTGWAAAQKGEEEGKKQQQQQQQGSGECVGLALVAETIKGNYKGAAGLWCLADAETAQASNGRVSASAAADAWRASGSCKVELLLQQSEASGAASAAAAATSGTSRGAAAADFVRGGEAGQDERAIEEGEKEEAESGAEKLADVVARRLLLEVQQGGVVDTAHQCLPLLFAALAEEHAVSRIRLSRLTPYAVQFIRHLRDFLGVVFHVETATTPLLDVEDSEHRQLHEHVHKSDSRGAGVTLKCVGVGLKNMARATF